MTEQEVPDSRGYFGQFGGQFVSDTLMYAVGQLETFYQQYRNDTAFLTDFHLELQDYVGRPTPLYFARRLTEKGGGAEIYLKREDLTHTGSHKINNALGQALLAKRMGKTRLIAETGAGQHGVAVATVAAKLGFKSVIYMGAKDVRRQAPNVARIKLLGAELIPVTSGSQTLKDALNEAMRDWVSHVDESFYIIGSVAGPHPYPCIVRDLQTVIGREARDQFFQKTGRLPDVLVACVGGGSNAMGLFYPFLNEKQIRIYGVEAAGQGLESGKHAASITAGRPGVLHGNRSYLLCDKNGQIQETHSIAAGLDYPGVGPEHAYLNEIKRVNYVTITDDEALSAFHCLTQLEGIIPALESSHAIAYTMKLAKDLPSSARIIVNLSGRGDKDMNTVLDLINKVC